MFAEASFFSTVAWNESRLSLVVLGRFLHGFRRVMGPRAMLCMAFEECFAFFSTVAWNESRLSLVVLGRFLHGFRRVMGPPDQPQKMPPRRLHAFSTVRRQVNTWPNLENVVSSPAAAFNPHSIRIPEAPSRKNSFSNSTLQRKPLPIPGTPSRLDAHPPPPAYGRPS